MGQALVFFEVPSGTRKVSVDQATTFIFKLAGLLEMETTDAAGAPTKPPLSHKSREMTPNDSQQSSGKSKRQEMQEMQETKGGIFPYVAPLRTVT